MKILNFKSKVFYKYFLSYLIVFIIPVMILGTMFYRSAVVNLQHEIELTNMNQLKQARNVIEQQYQILQNTATRISLDPNLFQSKVKNGGYESLLVWNELKKYNSNIIADEVFLYYKGEEIIHSSMGLNSLTTLSNSIYKFDDYDVKQFENYINSANHSEVLLAERPRGIDTENPNMLVYVVPIPVHYPRPSGIVLFFINETKMTSLIEDILGDFHGSVIVHDNQKKIIASNISGLFLDRMEISSFLNHKNDEDIYTQVFNKEKYSVSKVETDILGWTFMTVMPTNQFLDRVFETRLFILVLLLALFVTGLITALYFSFFHYRPIRELSEKIIMYWSMGKQHKKKDEIHQIHETFDAVYHDHKSLQVQIDHQRPLVQDQMLMRLLKGQISEEEEIEEQLSNLGFVLPDPHFFVVIISFQIISLDKKEEILSEYLNYSFENGKGYGVELVYENAIAMLFNFNGFEEIVGKSQRSLVQHIFNRMTEKYQLSPGFGVGQVYDSLSKVNRSFIEASAALEYKLKLGEGRLIFFDEIVSFQDKTVWYPIKDQVRLTQSLKQGDLVVSLEALKEIMSSIKSQEQSFLLLKCKCFDIINSVFRTINELELKESSEEIKNLLDFNTVEELEYKLQLLIHGICDQINNKREKNNRLFRDNILDYIHKNYISTQFNLEEVAEEFELSVSNLSRLIKELTGSTFTDYVFNLRMEKVKCDLVQGSMPIKEIVSSVGYLDVTSFNRKFKKIEGITPGQYRKLNSPDL
jgi:two-component system response regulator YesN